MNPRSEGSLAAEIRQTKGFRSLRQEAALGVLRTGDTLRRHFSIGLEGSDVTLQQYNVLRILRGAGPDGLATLEIGERMLDRTPGVTRLVDRLEKKGLVERLRHKDDRRVVRCALTNAGRSLVDGLDPIIDKADDESTGDLSESELKQLIALLDRIRGALSP